MAHRELVLSGRGGARRAALIEGGVLTRLAVDNDAAAPRAGDIILGRVRTVNAGLGAAFVDIGFARDGLLMRADWDSGAPPPSEGQPVRVRVLRAATPGKGAKLTTAIASADTGPPAQGEGDAAGARPPCTLFRAPSPVDALLDEALSVGVDRFACDDPEAVAAVRRRLGDAAAVDIVLVSGCAFRACGIDDAVDAALAPVIPLPGGGRVTIAETAAFVAIDVDTGAARDGLPARTALAVNRQAAAAIGLAVRLRDLGGTIVIDFVPMSRAGHRREVEAALRTAIGADDRQLRIAGFTRLGLFEMRRQRRGPSLAEALLAPCPTCAGSGRITAPAETARLALACLIEAVRGRAAGPPCIVVAPAVAAALRTDAAALLVAAEDALGRPVAVAEDPSLPPDGFRIEEGARQREPAK